MNDITDNIIGKGKFLTLLSSYVGTQNREWVRSRDAVAVLLYNIEQDSYLLLSQTRIPILPETVYEPVAGLIDDGEDPEDTAVRETQEETGLTIDALDLEEIGTFYSSQGLTNEKTTLYVVETDQNLLGVPSTTKWETEHETEFLNIKVVTLKQFCNLKLQDWRLALMREHILANLL